MLCEGDEELGSKLIADRSSVDTQALPTRDTQDRRGDARLSESNQRRKTDRGCRSEIDTPGCLAGILNCLLSVFRLSLLSARTYRCRRVKQARGEEKG